MDLIVAGQSLARPYVRIWMSFALWVGARHHPVARNACESGFDRNLLMPEECSQRIGDVKQSVCLSPGCRGWGECGFVVTWVDIFRPKVQKFTKVAIIQISPNRNERCLVKYASVLQSIGRRGQFPDTWCFRSLAHNLLAVYRFLTETFHSRNLVRMTGSCIAFIV